MGDGGEQVPMRSVRIIRAAVLGETTWGRSVQAWVRRVWCARGPRHSWGRGNTVREK